MAVMARNDLVNIQKYEWDVPCEFAVTQFHNPYLARTLSSAYNEGWLGIKNGIDMFVEDIRLDALTSQELDKYYAGQWSVAVGRLERRKLTITFRDYNQGTIYSKLVYFQKMLQDRYPTEQQWSIWVTKMSYATRKEDSGGIVSNVKNNISNLVSSSGIGSIISAVDNVFGTSINSSIFGTIEDAVGGTNNYLIKTNKAVLMSISGEQIGHNLENQFTRVSAEFVYTDNLNLNKDVSSFGSALGVLDSASSVLGKAMSFGSKFLK